MRTIRTIQTSRIRTITITITMNNNDFEKSMRDAQFRKGATIAYFNSLNSAIEMLKLETAQGEQNNRTESMEALSFWSQYFFGQYSKFHAENIATVGIERVDPKVIDGLKKAKKTYENKKGPATGDEGVVRG